jgi:hypothetical protein
MAGRFVETRHIGQHHGVRRRDRIEHGLHPRREVFDMEHVIECPAIGDKGGGVAGHGRPVDIGVHRPAPANRVAGEQKEPPECRDLIEIAVDLHAIGLRQLRDQIAAIRPAVPLHAADLVEKRRQDAAIRVPHCGEGIGAVRPDRFGDGRTACLDPPFVDAVGGIVHVAVVEPTVVGKVKDLTDGRTRTFRNHPIGGTAALRHPEAGKSHAASSLSHPSPH